MCRNALAATGQEYLDRARRNPHRHLAPEVAVWNRISDIVDPDMIIPANLALEKFGAFPAVPGERLERLPLLSLELQASADAAGRCDGSVIQHVQPLPHRPVELRQAEEPHAAQPSKDPRLNHSNRILNQTLVPRPFRAGRHHRNAVVAGEIGADRVQFRPVPAPACDSRLEIVDRQGPGTTAEIFEGTPVAFSPTGDLLVLQGNGEDQP